MRVRVDIPELMPELVEFLKKRGYDVSSADGDEITVTSGDSQDFRQAMTLLADLDVWRAKHPWVTTRLDPQLTSS
jgi:aspartate/methionine/tyrosine aminotransferase